jgi:DNA polymerase-3 subunit beta
MKFVADRRTLLESMNRLIHVSPRQNSLTILSHVLMEASEDGLRLTTTDIATTMSETINIKLETQGRITTPAQKLHEIIKAIPEGHEISFSAQSSNENTNPSPESQNHPQNHTQNHPGSLNVSSGSYRFSIMTLPADDFPSESYDQPTISFTLNAKDFQFLIDTTSFAVSEDDTRQYLNGTFLDPITDQNILRAVGTNGHQMAIADIPLPKTDETIPSIIIPKKLLGLISQLTKLSPEDETPIHVAISSHQIHISMDSIHIFSRLIDDKYPNYQQVIPQNNDKTLTLSKQDLDKSVSAVTIISSENKASVKLSLSENNVNVSTRSQNQETADVDIPAQYTHEPFSIGFNSSYLLQILQHCPHEDISIQLKDTQSPILIQAPENARFILMPVKV